MSQRLTDRELLAVRMERQGAAGARAADVVSAVRRCAGIQAQDRAAARLAVRARTRGLRLADVDRTCDEDRSVVQTWLMRATLHLVAAEDATWLIPLLGPPALLRYRARRQRLGLDDALCARALVALPEALGGGPLTRAQLVSELRAHGIEVNPVGQAPAHLVLFAAASGVLCRGPYVGNEPTYVALADWLHSQRQRPDGIAALAPGNEGGDLTGTAAAAELARRYFDAFSPATVEDFTSWSGLPPAQTRAAVAALGDELWPVSAAGSTMWVRGELPADPTAAAETWRLLPAFDSFLLGYRNRDVMLEPAVARRIQAGGGWIHPTVVCGGHVIGRWRLSRGRSGASVDVEPFHADAAARERMAVAVADEVRDIGRFLDEEMTLVIEVADR